MFVRFIVEYVDNGVKNTAVEQAVISAIIRDNQTYDRVSDLLEPDDFLEPVNRTIFEGLKTKLEQGKVADLMTLTAFFFEKGIPLAYVETVMENAPEVTEIRQYAVLLAELSTRRKLLKLSIKISEGARQENKGTEKLVAEIERDLFKMNRTVGAQTVAFAEGANEVLKIAKRILDSGESVSGVATGFADLDSITGGLRPGELIVLAGRPSTGKTAFATNIGTNVAMKKAPVLLISLEMPCDQICMRIVSGLAEVPLSCFMNGQITSEYYKNCVSAVERFRGLPLFIHDASFLTPGGVRSLVRYMKRQFGIGLVIIDYLQLLDSGERLESREQEIGRISRQLKLVAKEVEIPILALSQLSRDVEKRKESVPKLSDLRGSGAIEQDADVVIFLFKPENKQNQVGFSVAKNRNGALGDFFLFYRGELTRFENSL